jgi:hypothetical protein
VSQTFAFQLPGRIALFRIPSLAQRLFVSACDIGWRSLAGIWLFLHKLPLLTILRTNRNADLFNNLGITSSHRFINFEPVYSVRTASLVLSESRLVLGSPPLAPQLGIPPP